MRFERFQSITRLLIQKIVWVSVACTIVIGSIRAYSLYRMSEHQFNDTLNVIAAVYVPQLAISVWDIEPKSIESQLHSMVDSNDTIAYVRLELTSGRKFANGEQAATIGLSPHHFVLHEPGTTSQILGHLYVYADASNFYKMLLFQIGLSIFGYVLLTLLICQLVRLILRRHLRKPLKEIAAFARELDAQKLLTPLHLTDREHVVPNEIDLVVAGFDMLQTELGRHINHLDQLVAERTAQLEQAMQSIQLLSITDPLTGCYNRHYLNEQLERIADSASQQPLTVIFCDVDFFKQVNDRFGHKAGDDVLAKVGEVLRQGLRCESDWVARYGGEEFLLVLPKTDLATAHQIAERLRLDIAALSFQCREQCFQISSSFGVAELRQDESAQQLCERADQLLYQAKNSGRNRVCSA